MVVVKGNLSPQGAVLKPSAASPLLMKHTGKAVVFENIDDYKARIDDPDLDVEEIKCFSIKKCWSEGISRNAGSG